MIVGAALVGFSFGSMSNGSLYEKLRYELYWSGEPVKSRYWYAVYCFMYTVCSVGTDDEISSSWLRKSWKNAVVVFIVIILGSLWPLHLLLLKLWG